jgi:[ribosomal protein S5]-alanine N-acetyltransferase
MQAAIDGTIKTERLVLRTVLASDASDVMTLAGDWDVARMLADMPFPLTAERAGTWAQSASEDRSHAITFDGRMIGGLSVCPIEQSHLTIPAELGFWLGKAWWGRGFAREAAGAAIAHHLLAGEVDAITSGHFADNPASGRVLKVLGFTATGMTQQWCLARQETMRAIRYVLPSPDAATADATAFAAPALSIQS